MARTRYASVVALLVAIAACSHGATRVVGPTEREVVFQNHSVALRGTLLMPTGQGPFPAVVFLHGSGPHTREGFRFYAEQFAALGVASLFFDKRGTGASGGSWITASLDDLVGDALAALAYLASVEQVDGSRIGLWGVSQAGWIAPLAASRSNDVAFMMVISGGGASPRESEMHSYRGQFLREAFSQAETDRALDVLDAYFRYLDTGERREALLARLDVLDTDRLRRFADQLRRIVPGPDNRENWRWVATHDPRPSIEALDCPVLLLFGDRDADHPTPIAVERWRGGLAKAGNEHATVVVFPGAGHGIRVRDGHAGGRAPFADGYLDVQIGWLWRQVVIGDGLQE